MSDNNHNNFGNHNHHARFHRENVNRGGRGDNQVRYNNQPANNGIQELLRSHQELEDRCRELQQQLRVLQRERERRREDIRCPNCRQVYGFNLCPMALPCGHTYCNVCSTRFVGGRYVDCPFHGPTPSNGECIPPNLALIEILNANGVIVQQRHIHFRPL